MGIRFILYTGILFLVMSAVGCKLETSNTQPLPERSGTTSTTAENLIAEIETELLSAGFSQSQTETIKTKARSNVLLAGLESSTDLTLVTPEVLRGALLGVSDISDHDSKVEAIEILTTCLILSSQSVATENRSGSRRNYSISEPQYSITSYASLLKTIASISIQYMDDIGIESESLNTVITVVIKGISSTLKGAGISDDDLPAVMKEVTEGAVSALDETGKDDSDIAEAIDAVTAGIFQGLQEAGMDTSGISDIADDVTSGAVTGLQDAGVEDEAVDAIITSLKTGITDGLSEAGLSDEEISLIQEIIDTAAEEAESALESSKAITSFKFLASLNSAISTDVIGTIDETNKTISLTVPSGTNLSALIATFETTGNSVVIAHISGQKPAPKKWYN